MNESRAPGTATGEIAITTPGVVRLVGPDALSLLHNLATQSLLDLPAGGARMTLFCDFRGRLLHRAAVARMADDSVWLVRPDAAGDSLAAHIDRHRFRERVTLDNWSARFHVNALPLAAPDEIGRVIESEAGVRITPAAGFSLRLGPANDQPARGAQFGGLEWERVHAGWPRHGHEIREAFHPFEVGLAGEVHLDKGCYTGQEALMRRITYRSVKRRLVLLGPIAPGAGIAAGTNSPLTLTRSGTRVGASSGRRSRRECRAHCRW